MVKKKKINAEKFTRQIGRGKWIVELPIEDDKKTNLMKIEAVKLIGKIKGIKENIELIMDRETFFDWIKKIKEDGKK